MYATLSFAGPGPIVQTEYGDVQGFTKGNVNVFLGIPFAAPPVGGLRWKAPTKPTSWNDVRDATQYSPACIQAISRNENITSVSEDCLYLNIYTPQGAQDLPVMLWIYGGSFKSGDGELYEAVSLATEQRAIIVNFNYRLGTLGYLSLEALLYEDPSNPGTGNYGMMDQRAAMQWVQQNIQAFGGDPTKVMIFGESAGAISVCYHIAAPASSGLFRAALMESGFCTISTLSSGLSLGNNISLAAGCNQSNPTAQLACLRQQDAHFLGKLGQVYTQFWYPVIDGYSLTQQPIAYIESGNFNQVPLVLGTNKNEYSLFACPLYQDINATQYIDLVYKTYGEGVAKYLLQLYDPSNYDTPAQALVDLLSDLYFICPTRRAARAMSDNSLPVYLYAFKHVPGWSKGCYGVAHSFELPFIFNQLAGLYNYQFTPQEIELSENMTTYWMNFAETLTPNTDGQFEWPLYNSTMDESIILDLELSTEVNYKSVHCDFWDQLN